jgi:hypothetical protein
MPDPLPAAHAVWHAYETANCDPYLIDPRRAGVVAALRAAAEQADPKRHIEDIDYVHQMYTDGCHDTIATFLSIAAELEAQ